ncbi:MULTISPECIES: flagellar hook-basal body protein [unclassified Bacillus (in: firmicutes)]|uniref:flagellar hook-basal body protein n=1 Tax=unclassified Bacillus (in: firmicutes) TaxID=185979 RepID=UPI0008EC92F4|nr:MULTISPECIES: flagellar hook-basal body protein [unclassified Bacillus (in: firmicutes)]SFB04181.1 flagellar basal-body rod protein FlgG [Bacillus sp. UNCCL13]SFQ88563.1 flagellar basal-body rod protein FlgG [Bacillus sp. cl95]
MFKGFYTVASGMFAQQHRTEMLTNNMANANTPGFKADQASLRAFPEMLLQKMDKYSIPTENGLNLPYNKTIGPINSGVYVQDIAPNFLQGDLQQTDKKTDVSLLDVVMPANQDGATGSVFFTVQHPSGASRYTRNGNFTLDHAGFLTTGSGLFVLDDRGQKIQLSSDQFSINEAGVLTGANGEQARLGIGFSQDPNRLIKEGDGLFRTEDGTPLTNAFNEQGAQFKLQQGFLERSNVDASRTMTDMLTAYRAFEANQKVLQAYDRSMEKAANEIGRVG